MTSYVFSIIFPLQGYRLYKHVQCICKLKLRWKIFEENERKQMSRYLNFFFFLQRVVHFCKLSSILLKRYSARIKNKLDPIKPQEMNWNLRFASYNHR